jgi:hypothetical protein
MGMGWKWARALKKDKRFSESSYFVSKAASSELRYAALDNSKVLQFASVMQPGGVMEPPKRKKKSKIGVHELGRAILLPDDFVLFRSYDPKNPVQRHLVRQLLSSFDRCATEALKQNALETTTSMATIKKLIPGAGWTDLEAILGIISGYMFSCVQPYESNHYVGIGGVKFLRQIKCLPKFLPWREYLKGGDILFLGEVGLTNNNIRWVDCKDMTIFSNDAVVFGDKGLGIQEVSPIELRVYKSIIAWYGVLEFGGQNVVHIIPPGRRRKDK